MGSIDRYREYRDGGKDLNNRIIELCLDEATIKESAELLGLGLTDEIESVPGNKEVHVDVGKDFAMHEYRQGKQTAVASFQEQELWESELEKELLDAFIQSGTSLFRVTSVNEAEGILIMEDLLNDVHKIKLTDIGLSKSVDPGLLLFCRLIRLEEVNMTSGVTLPFPDGSEEILVSVYEDMRDEIRPYPDSVVRYISFYGMYEQFGIEIQVLR